MAIYKLYTDGSYQEKLGIASIGGYIISPTGETIFKFSEPLTETNTFKYHEDIAMLYGLNKALKMGIKEIECFSDSKNISDVMNKSIFTNKESISLLKEPYKVKIAQLIDSFAFINFNYLPRSLNKAADKLAGKTLKNHKEDNFQLKKRSFFIGQEDKMLHVPNLLCEEDFQVNNTVPIFAKKRKQLVYHYLVEIIKNTDLMSKEDLFINYYIIERNPKDHKKILSKLIYNEEIKQSDLFVKVIEGLTNIFKNSPLKEDTGLMFDANNFLRYPEMILRKRGVLHKPNTELINNFIESTSVFPNIYLHNDEKLIKTHKLLLQNNNKINRIKM